MLGRNSRRHFLFIFHEYLLLSPPYLVNHIPKSESRLVYRCGTSKLYSSSTSSRKRSIKPQTHYELFPQTAPSGPPPEGPFEIDVRKLKKEFLQLQAKAHPDLHQGENRARAEGASALINEAYKTLQNPLRRAQYLLSLRGIDVAEDETAKVDDPELLMDVLEAREEIENANQESDLELTRQINNGRIEDSTWILEAAFEKDDMKMAKEETVKLRYWINIKDSLDAWEKGKPVVLSH